MAIDLDGILPPITTPFNAAGDLDLDALRRNIERYNTTGLRGYVAFGSNGEAVHLDAAERERILRTVQEAAAPGMALVAGINELSARAAHAAIRQAADAGADAALVITPYFYKGMMSQEVLREFFLEVASESTLPILLYNVPQNTGIVLEPETIAELSGEEKIIGVKDSSGNLKAMSETLRMVSDEFNVLVGNAGACYSALSMGARGGILAVACAAPRPAVALHAAVRAGDDERARELQEALQPLGRAVTVEHGIPGLKASLDMAGLDGGSPRSPLRPLTEEARAQLQAVMQATGFFD